MKKVEPLFPLVFILGSLVGIAFVEGTLQKLLIFNVLMTWIAIVWLRNEVRLELIDRAPVSVLINGLEIVPDEGTSPPAISAPYTNTVQ